MRKEDEQQLHAVRFAAGVAVLMACLERAALVSFFEQWRVWVFLALNLLLLAILFTSTYTTCSGSGSTPPNELSSSSSSSAQEENNTNNVELKSEGKKRILKQCSNLEPTKSTDDNPKILKSESMREEIIRNYSVEEEEEEEEDERKSSGLSKEELNEKVEAFIAMFRQQYLVSDHSKVTSRRRRRKSHQAPVMGGGCHFVPSHISVG